MKPLFIRSSITREAEKFACSTSHVQYAWVFQMLTYTHQMIPIILELVPKSPRVLVSHPMLQILPNWITLASLWTTLFSLLVVRTCAQNIQLNNRIKSSVYGNISTDTCGTNCTKHGLCNEGVCECHPGFTGYDCSQAPPYYFNNVQCLKIEQAALPGFDPKICANTTIGNCNMVT